MTLPRIKWVLFSLILILAGSAAGVWAYLQARPAVPPIPAVDLARDDAEVAEVIKEAQDAVLKTPRSSEAWGKLGTILHTNFHKEEAVTCYVTACALDPANSKWQYLLGEVYMTLGKAKSAVPCWEKAAKLAPPDSTVERLSLGDLYLEVGLFDKAETAFRTVLAASRHDAAAQFGLGQVAMNRQENKEALGYLEAVSEERSCRKRACAFRAQIQDRLGNKQAAERELRWHKELPDDIPWPNPIIDQIKLLRVGLSARLERADGLLMLKQPGEAIKILKEATDKFPRSDRAWSRLGKAFGIVNNYVDSEHAFLRSIVLAPEKAEHHYFLGVLHQLHSNHKVAEEQFEEASKLSPNDADAPLKRGECLEALGDRKGAEAAYRQALERKPQMKEAQDRLDKLTGKT